MYFILFYFLSFLFLWRYFYYFIPLIHFLQLEHFKNACYDGNFEVVKNLFDKMDQRTKEVCLESRNKNSNFFISKLFPNNRKDLEKPFLKIKLQLFDFYWKKE